MTIVVPATTRNLLLLAGVISILAVAWLIVPVQSDSPPKLRRTEDPGDSPSTMIVEDSPAAAPVRLPIVSEALGRLRVVDERGDPVAGAQITLSPAMRRSSEPSGVVLLGSTDDSGGWETADAIADNTRVVTISKASYRSAVLTDGIEVPSNQLVTLAAGSVLRVRTMVGGQPQSGLLVEASMASLPVAVFEGLSGEVQLGLDPRTVVLAGNSDDDGWVEFSGLAEGAYDLRAGGNSYVRRGALVRSNVAVAGRMTEAVLDLAPLVGAAVVFVGEEPLYVAPSYPRRSVLMGCERQVWYRDINASMPGAHVFVAGFAGTDPVLTLAAMFPRRGLLSFSVPLVPVSSVERSDISVAEFPVINETGSLRVVLIGDDGSELKGFQMVLTPEADKKTQIPASCGDPIALSVGRYVVRSYDAFLSFDPKVVTVVAGEEAAVSIRVPMAVARAEIAVQSPDGDYLRDVVLRFEQGEWQYVCHASYSSGLSLTLPYGDVQITVSGAGYAEHTETVVIEKPHEELVVHLDR